MNHLNFTCFFFLNLIIQLHLSSSSPTNAERFIKDLTRTSKASDLNELKDQQVALNEAESNPNNINPIQAETSEGISKVEPAPLENQESLVHQNDLIEKEKDYTPGEKFPNSETTKDLLPGTIPIRSLKLDPEANSQEKWKRATTNQTKTLSSSTPVLLAKAAASSLAAKPTSPVQSAMDNHPVSVASQLAKATAVAPLPSAKSTAQQSSPNSLSKTFSELYKPSNRLYGVVLALTFAFGLGVLLVIISVLRCVCQRRKFANPKDYPNGFPWEMRERRMAQRLASGQEPVNAMRPPLAPIVTSTGQNNNHLSMGHNNHHISMGQNNHHISMDQNNHHMSMGQNNHHMSMGQNNHHLSMGQTGRHASMGQNNYYNDPRIRAQHRSDGGQALLSGRTSFQGYLSATPSPNYESKSFNFGYSSATAEMDDINSPYARPGREIPWENPSNFYPSAGPTSATPCATDDSGCESHRDEVGTPLSSKLARQPAKDEQSNDVPNFSLYDFGDMPSYDAEKQSNK